MNEQKHLARTIILQKLFERQFRNQDLSKTLDPEFTNEQLASINSKGVYDDMSNTGQDPISLTLDAGAENKSKYDKKLANQLLQGVINYQAKTDAIIEKLATEWPLEQINKTDIQILRLAIYEGFIAQITPKKVAINEAVELAKEFGGGPSGKFVNGVLGTLLAEEAKFKTALSK